MIRRSENGNAGWGVPPPHPFAPQGYAREQAGSGFSLYSSHGLPCCGVPLQSVTRNTVFAGRTIIICLSMLGLSCSTPSKVSNSGPSNFNVVAGGDWVGYDYSYFCPAYKFSEGGQTSTPWSTLDANALSLVKAEHQKAFEAVEAYIRNRAGDYFDQLVFDDVDITYSDSAALFVNKRPLYDMNKCGKTKYYFRYRFSPFSNVDYRIGIALDDKFSVISPYCFPASKRGTHFWEIITPDSAVRSALISFKNRIIPVGEVKLEYDQKLNCFSWRVEHDVPEGLNEGRHSFDFVNVNANTGKIAGHGSFRVSVVINRSW